MPYRIGDNKVGERVLAVRDGNQERLHIFGEGVYVGDLYRPDMPPEPSARDRAMYEEVVQRHDAVPVDQHWYVLMTKRLLAQGVDTRTSVEEARDYVTASRKRSLRLRALELYEATRRSACIYLNSGDIVWGHQCWWGEIHTIKERFPHAEIVKVPLPQPTERWHENGGS